MPSIGLDVGEDESSFVGMTLADEGDFEGLNGLGRSGDGIIVGKDGLLRVGI